MYLLPVIDSDDLPDDIYEAFEDVVPFLYPSGHKKIQEYLIWPLELKAKTRREMSDEVYDSYREVSSFLIDELETISTHSNNATKILIRPY